MKKICIVTTVSLTIRSFILPLLSYYLENTDWDITVICDDDPDLRESLPPEVHYIPVSMKRGIDWHGPAVVFELWQIFRKEKFDLVQYSTPNASFYTSAAAWLAGIPVRLYCQWGIAYVGFRGLKRHIFKSVEKTVCRLSGWIEPDSYGNLNFSHSEGLYPRNKGSVVWNGSAAGVDLTKFDHTKKYIWRSIMREKYGIPDDAFVYCFIGRVTGDKGINELFGAFKIVVENNENTYLLIVGNPEISDSVDRIYNSWAEENPNVLFCGYTNEVEKYLAASDAYVLPSYREGFGSAVIEAEAMGIPVIVTDIPGPTEAMKKDLTGLVVPMKNTEALEDAMIKLYSDPDLCLRFGEEGLKYASDRFEQKALFNHILRDRQRLLGERDPDET